MTKQASAVLWIGILLIFANFWISGQSQVFWSAFSKNTSSGTTPAPSTSKTPTTTNISKGQVAGVNPVISGVAGRGR